MPMWGGDGGCHRAMVAYSKDAAIILYVPDIEALSEPSEM